MLILSDYLERRIEENKKRELFFDSKMNYFLNDLMEKLDIEDAEEIAFSLERTFSVCKTLNISINNNFKKIYRFNGETLISDWKISPLACYLIVINCNPIHESAAKAQLFFITNNINIKLNDLKFK